MIWVGRDLKHHVVPTPVWWTGPPSTKPGCSKPIQPGLEHCQGGHWEYFSESRNGLTWSTSATSIALALQCGVIQILVTSLCILLFLCTLLTIRWQLKGYSSITYFSAAHSWRLSSSWAHLSFISWLQLY